MRSTNNPVFELLKEYLVNNYGAKVASGGKEVIKRCHICGDSRDLSDAHMYIGMKNGAIVYNCFKCGNSGSLNSNFFRDIGCYETNLISLVNEQNKSAYKNNRSLKGYVPKRFKPNLAINVNNPVSKSKLDYINNRLGLSLDYRDLIKLNISLNISDFIGLNYIRNTTRHPSVMQDLDRYFIGFLTVDRNFLIMRRLVDEGIVNPSCDSRYVNYNIWNTEDDNRKFYIIPTSIDPTNPNPIKIHIAEGVFDVLGIYFNTDKDHNHSVFGSYNGKSFWSLIQYFISDIGFINFELHIYPDNDVDNRSVINILRDRLMYFNCSVYLHRNIYPGEKDFGVRREQIKESVMRIL